MVDPVSGSGAELVRQVAEQTTSGEPASAIDESGSSEQFDATLEQTERIDGVREDAEVERVESAQHTGAPVDADGVGELEETGFRDFISELGGDRERLDAMLEKCRSGREMEQHELLELQGLIYGYSQRVEIATKVADKAAGGLKQMMNVRV